MPDNTPAGKKQARRETRRPEDDFRRWLPLILITTLVFSAVAVMGYLSQSPPQPALPVASPTAQPVQGPPQASPAGKQPATLPTATPLPAPTGFVPSYTGGPRLAIEKPDLDLGTIFYDQHIVAAWTLRNVGNAPLHIQPAPMAKAVEGC